MRLFKINSAYSNYLTYFYRKNYDYKTLDYSGQKRRYFNDAFSWGDAWTNSLSTLDYEVTEIVVNEEYMQRQWAKENKIIDWKECSLNQIVLYQLKEFNPDIVWFDTAESKLVELVLETFPDIKCKIAWLGSAVYNNEIWKNFDLVITCAPETKKLLEGWGVNVVHLHHAFDSRVLGQLNLSNEINDLTFIGQILKFNNYHVKREEMLKHLAEKSSLTIYSPGAEKGKSELTEYIEIFIKRMLYGGYQLAKSIGKDKLLKQRLRLVDRISKWEAKPEYVTKALDKKLRKVVKEAVYGLDMLQTIRDSKITLNIHADSSPEYASNMRLFEVTGVGGCLLTDWRRNINELFEPDYEVVTYKSLDECIEKVEWLLQNDESRKQIAEAGQKRVLREHTFQKRGEQLDSLLKSLLRRL